MKNYEYDVVSVPRSIGVTYGSDSGMAIAEFLSKIINEKAHEGWEFYRTDNFSVAQTPGCLAAICGAKETFDNYNVVTFRRERI